MRRVLSFLMILNLSFCYAQTSTIADFVENDPYKNVENVPLVWLKEDRHYAHFEKLGSDTLNSILISDIQTGEHIDTSYHVAGEAGRVVVESFSYSPDEKYLLLESDTKKSYRHSYSASYYLLDIEGETLYPINNGKHVSYPSFSPDSKMIAYVKGPDIYYTRLDNNSEFQITKSGVSGKLKHGSADWVYEEEFGMTSAFHWSPDSKRIAFLSFNESNVAEYHLQRWTDEYPEITSYRYPRPGGANSVVTASIYDIEKNTTSKVNVGLDKDYYLPKIRWTESSNVLAVVKVNRLQNRLEILHCSVMGGNPISILKENSKTYIDANDKILHYLNDGSFLFTSDRDGYLHLYHHSSDGQLINQVTSGSFDFDEFYGTDPAQKLVYFSGNKGASLEKHVFSKTLKGNKYRKISLDSGYNSASFSSKNGYVVVSNHSLKNAPKKTIYTLSNLKPVRILEQTEVESNSSKIRLFSYRNREQTQLNGYLVVPESFDSTKVYPLLVYTYGGPGSQQVQNRFDLPERSFHEYLASKGVLVACIDNRGTGGRGRDFKNTTYLQLGKLEVEDLQDAVGYLGSQSFIDVENIGIWGKSYGGYLAAKTLFNSSDILSYGVAVAPVTDWRLYNTAYSERFMQRPTDNEAGYDESSLLNEVQLLKDPFLLIHGTNDDNVHLQHSMALSKALISFQVPFSTVYYPSVAHSFAQIDAKKHLYMQIEHFITNSGGR
jgi:dipeptidyl-peptidase-4